MAKKHQIFSSNKGTRTKAGRKWRRQAKQLLTSRIAPRVRVKTRRAIPTPKLVQPFEPDRTFQRLVRDVIA